MVKNLSFHCRGRGFSPSLGTRDLRRQPKKKELDVCGRGGMRGCSTVRVSRGCDCKGDTCVLA